MAETAAEDILPLLTAFGIEAMAKQINASKSVRNALKQTLASSGLASAEKSVGTLFFTVASGVNGGDTRAHRREWIARRIGTGALKTSQQVNAAISFANKQAPDAEISDAEFEKACGANVFFTEEQIKAQVKEVFLREFQEILLRERYLVQIGTLLAPFKQGDMAWADGKLVKDALDAEILALIGPRTAEDDKRAAEAMASKKAAAKADAKKDSAVGAGASTTAATTTTTTTTTTASSSASSGAAASVGVENAHVFDARELKAAINSPELLKAHLEVTKGVVRTRFPPEPNGYLHIGHAKSMSLNFEMAFRYLGAEKGETIFRYDDTNPDAESQEYIDNQAENVAWMGWKPVKVTHSADYFPQLYDYALTLIRKGKAYVCHQTKEQMEASREISRARDGRDPNSPWRDRPIEESVKEFEAMRAGKYEEGKAVLRLKIDMTSPNPTLWDPVAYRIKFTPHPHTGDAWCIYPSYDYSHCIIDSIENIDFSLCTLEFEVRRDLYYWVLEQLNIWRPYVWEFARLNITHVQLSKRKILKLVNEKTVRGWDDPRIPTINGLRRRGYTAESINAFCRDIGVTRNDNTIEHQKLEHHVRLHLDSVAKRDFIVLKPLKVTLINVPTDYSVDIVAPDFPRDAALGTHICPLTNTVYIDQDDFRLEDSADYYGLAPGKTAGLRYAGYVKVVEVVKDATTGAVIELKAEYDAERKTPGKIKGNLHWVSSATPGGAPTSVEIRLYDHLFNTEAPGSTGDSESELNKNSEIVVTTAFVNPTLAAPNKVKNWDHFQFERVGYFVADKDSNFATGNLVFNLTVGLKENTEVKKVRGK